MELKDFISNFWQTLQRKAKVSKYRNLVFKGGGVRGIAYMGALEVLDELNVVEQIERVAGTSSGAIAATLLSFRKDIPETLRIFNTLDLKKVPQKVVKSKQRNIPFLKNSENYTRLFENYGWFSSLYFHKWLQAVIADQCRGNSNATFRDFQELGFRDLHVVASNISRHRAEVFSVHDTPDVGVADAVRMSMSIPLYFEALQFDGKRFGSGDFYVDGGVYNNYPVHLFDKPRYARASKVFHDGVNGETLGLFLFPGELGKTEKAEDPEHLWEFLDLVIRSYYGSHQTADIVDNVVDKKRTIWINDCGISSTQFDLPPGSKEFINLYESGGTAVRAFFGI